MIVLAAALLLVASGHATTIDIERSLDPTVFPGGRDAPLNARFLVLESWAPSQIRLVTGDGQVVRARVRRLAFGIPVLEVAPRRALEPDRSYCIEIVSTWRRAALGRTCVHTGDAADVVPPSGGQPAALTLLGSTLGVDAGPGVDESDVALELEVRQEGQPMCRDLAVWLRPHFQAGDGIELDGPQPGSGTQCFALPADSTVSLRVRWRDAAGNYGPWSAWWERLATAPGVFGPS